MAGPLLESKLRLPRPRAQAVARARLTELLGRTLEATVTLVCAPAGFGKTTVLSQWLAPMDGAAVAWISLDERDNDPARFWEYVVTAVQRATGSAIGAVTLEMLRPPQPPEVMLAPLLNDIESTDGELGQLLVVLDDYHLIDAAGIHEGLSHLSITCPRTSIWCSRRGPTRRSRCLGCGPAACSSRFARLELRFTRDEADAVPVRGDGAHA